MSATEIKPHELVACVGCEKQIAAYQTHQEHCPTCRVAAKNAVALLVRLEETEAYSDETWGRKEYRALLEAARELLLVSQS